MLKAMHILIIKYQHRLDELTHGITEVGQMFTEHHSVVTAFNMNDYEGLFHLTAGIGGRKYASINIEAAFGQFQIANIPYEELFDLTFSGYIGLASWNAIMTLYIHEFTHTIEANYWYDPVQGYMDYHAVLNAYGRTNDLGITKQYLQNKAVLNGETGGIPEEFWEKFKIS